jgi:hypothetical protein
MASRFDRETIREYFEFCQRTGRKRVNSIEGLTSHAHATGNNDEEIREWLFPSEGGPTVECPACGGSGRIPEPPPPVPAVCTLCRGAREVLRFDFETRRDEVVPCVCASGGPTPEELRAAEERLEEARRKGAQTLSRMLGVGELATAILPVELKLVDRKDDEGAARSP